VLDHELHGHIRREIARLAPKFRDALLLAAAGEQSYNDIAVMLGIPVGTLKWRVNEARRQLKGKLAAKVTDMSETRHNPGLGARDSGLESGIRDSGFGIRGARCLRISTPRSRPSRGR